jgi:hypothetical protein
MTRIAAMAWSRKVNSFSSVEPLWPLKRGPPPGGPVVQDGTQNRFAPSANLAVFEILPRQQMTGRASSAKIELRRG